MTNRIKVRPAGDDRRVPLETGGGYFPQGEATETALTRYIQRRLRDGDLIEDPAEQTPPAQAQAEQPNEESA
jgi:hypothetical protein